MVAHTVNPSTRAGGFLGVLGQPMLHSETLLQNKETKITSTQSSSPPFQSHPARRGSPSVTQSTPLSVLVTKCTKLTPHGATTTHELLLNVKFEAKL